MPVDRAILDHEFKVSLDLERGRLKMFAESIGEQDPLYLDVEAAREAGHPDILAAPTVLFGLELETSDTFETLADHGVDLGRVLHGEQKFTYHKQIYAGDHLDFASKFSDVYEKSGGALEFIVRHTEVRRGDDGIVAEMDNVAVVRG